MSEPVVAALILVIGGFLKVFLAGIQVKNLQHDRIRAAFFTSLGLNISDLILVKVIVDSGALLLVLCAFSQALGIVAAIYLFKRSKAT